jgi:thiamine kinase-like enzyme
VKHYKVLKNQKIKEFSRLKQQGHCNINYFLETENQNYLVRRFKYKSDRKAEFYIQNLAHKKGVAAKALLLDEEKQLMICDFIEGRHRYKLDQHTLKKLAMALKKLHQVKLQQQAYTFKRSFKYKDKKVYEAFNTLKQFKPEYVLGHNDLHAKNILFGKKVQFIDWEYAGMSDRYFDLAAIIIEFKLNTKDEKNFLRTYFSRNRSINHKKLNAYKVIYRTLWTVWFSKLERGQI